VSRLAAGDPKGGAAPFPDLADNCKTSLIGAGTLKITQGGCIARSWIVATHVPNAHDFLALGTLDQALGAFVFDMLCVCTIPNSFRALATRDQTIHAVLCDVTFQVAVTARPGTSRQVVRTMEADARQHSPSDALYLTEWFPCSFPQRLGAPIRTRGKRLAVRKQLVPKAHHG